MTAQVTLLQGDCLDLLPAVPDRSVDLILTDLPYGKTHAAWDTPIPLEPLWAEYRRVLASHGTIVLTAVQPFTSQLVMSNPDWFRYSLVWEKDRPTGFLNARRQPLRIHEDILVFSEHAPRYFPQMTPVPPYVDRTGASTTTSVHFNGRRTTPRAGRIVEDAFPRSVLTFPREWDQTSWQHPTQKPVALFAYLIRTYTHEGELVLDTCSGSGTTAIAALRTGRRALCLERDAHYHARSLERVRQEQGLWADEVTA